MASSCADSNQVGGFRHAVDSSGDRAMCMFDVIVEATVTALAT